MAQTGEKLAALASSSVPAAVEIDIYGLGARICGDWPEVLEALRLDYAWFEHPRRSAAASGAAPVEVTIERRPPDFEAFGNLRSSFVTPRNVVYQVGERTVIDYFATTVSILDRGADRLVIQGEDEATVHEAAYLFLLSRAGRHLDAIGLPRVHGLALAGSAGGVVLLLPSGGGKSALGLRALRTPGLKPISEDSALLDRRGRLHPFALRIGIHPGDAGRIGAEAEGLRRIERMEFGPKLAVEVDSFRDRIATAPVPLRHLVIGRRCLGTEAALTPLPRRAAVGPLLREAVVGVGIYQGMEFVLQRGMRDVIAHAGTALRRAAHCAAALSRVSVWRLETGRDHERNWEALRTLL